MDKILLLADIPLCNNYTGGLMNSQLVSFLVKNKVDIYCFCLLDRHLAPNYNEIMNRVHYVQYERPSEMVNDNYNIHKYNSELNKIKKKLLTYIKKNHITKIWCPVQGDVLTELLNYVYKKTNIPYVAQIWDPIEWWIKEHNFSNEQRINTLNKHDIMIKNASSIITTSYSMSEYFESKFSSKCFEVFPPVSNRKKIYNSKKDNNKYIIALTGQIYASNEFDSMLNALDSISWKINDKDIYFYHYGLWNPNYIDEKKHSKYKHRIVSKGFFNQDELFGELSNVDLLYCPYFFSDDEDLKKVSMLSFPSKLITYLSLDIPVIYHGPSYSGPYKFLESNNCAYLIDSMEISNIVKVLNSINIKKSQKFSEKIDKIFYENFSNEKNSERLMLALGIDNLNTRLNVLEVNNVDLPGRVFNGYDLMEEFNKSGDFDVKQIVTYKTSNNKNVCEFYNPSKMVAKEWQLLENEAEIMSVHNQVSYTGNILKNSIVFKEADLIHYHLIHNTKLSLPQMIELSSQKPTIWTFHDQWNYTGRCVCPQECEKWKNGCNNCEYLDSLFPLKKDNCNALWKQKKEVYNNLDIDIIVSTPFMEKMMLESPIINNCNIHYHVIPFGVNLDIYKDESEKSLSRKKWDISDDEIVLFFRAQLSTKGTEYIIEALDNLEIADKKITLLTCSEKGLCTSLIEKYRVIDLGNINHNDVITAMNACDIFLMPSRGESFGMMAIEAMASGRPIIIFDNSSLPYVTHAPECGYLVPNKDVDKLKDAIIDLINNKDERDKRGNLGRKIAVENYDINKYHEKIREVYKEAYERQKQKKEIIFATTNINDIKSHDVQQLLLQLKELFNNIYPNIEFPMSLEKMINHDYLSKKDFKIDYSNPDVIMVLKIFNNEIYKLLMHDKKYLQQNKFKKFMYLLKNDRYMLYCRFEAICNKIPVIGNIIIFLFKVARRLKRILCLNYYKNLKKENNEIRDEIEIIKKELEKIQNENRE